MRVWLLAGTVAIAFAFSAAGCNDKKEAATTASDPDGSSPGAQVFADAGCGNCHALGAAGATGTKGPNLDDLKPPQDRVALQVRNGGVGMPSFRDKLSSAEIQQVAAFVASAARTATTSSSISSFRRDDRKIEDCDAVATKNNCYEQAFANLAYDEGPKAALDRFQEMERSNRDVFENCHQIAHYIGAAGLLRFDGNIAKAFAEGNSTCGSGYYHGLLQWKLAGVQPKQVAGIAREVCNNPEIKANPFNYYQCDHGLGHGLMLYTAYDLPAALGYCHKLNTKYDQTSCTGGVFMENLSSSFGLKTKWLDPKNLLYPCNSKVVRESDKLYCYLIIAQRIFPAVDNNWKKTADWCRRSEPAWVNRCFESIGRTVASASQRNADEMRVLCHKAGNGEKHCLSGAVVDVLNNNASDPAAKELCDSVELEFRAYCFGTIGFMVGLQHPDPAGKQQACRQFAARVDDFRQCLSSAGP